MPTPLNPTIVALARQSRPEYTEYRHDQKTGYLNSDNTVNPDLASGLDAGYIYVHNADGRANTRAKLPVRLAALAYVSNVPVTTALDRGGERVVTDVDSTRMTSALYGQLVQAVSLATVTPSQNIQGGRVQPSPLGGLYVWVEMLPEAGWEGGNLLIDSGDVPTGAATACWAEILLDRASGIPSYTLTTAESSLALDGTDLSPTSAWDVTIAATAYRLGAVSLSYGQTDINYSTSVFVDQRRWLVEEGSVLTTWTGVPGFGAPVGTVSNYWFDTATVTHEELAQVVAALIQQLQASHQETLIPVPTPVISSPATDDTYTDDTTPTFTVTP